MKSKKKWYWWLGLYLVIGWAVFSIYEWLVTIPLMLMGDFASGLGYAIGNLSVLAVGIWLMKKGKAKVASPVSGHKKNIVGG